MEHDKASIEAFVTAAIDGKPADAAAALEKAMEPVVADIIDQERADVTQKLFGKRPGPEDENEEESEEEEEIEDDEEVVEIDLDQLSDEELDQLVDYLENQEPLDADEGEEEEEEEENE
jgi:hypothetical protein